MYIAEIPNRDSPPAYLLRESYREDGKVKNRTVANLSKLPLEQIELIRQVLKGESLVPAGSALEIVESLPVGHVAAILGLMRKLGLPQLLDRRQSRARQLVMALIVSRITQPGSKLATARALSDEAPTSALKDLLEIEDVDEDALYEALDWLRGQQARIENSLAKRHLKEGCLVLYDVSSSYLEGRECELGAFGHNRDGKAGKLQIVYGLLCAPDGCPVAVEVFSGNTADPSTLGEQIKKVKERFQLSRVVFVADRGLITSARITEELAPASLDWISALRADQIRGLVQSGALQLSIFDQVDLAEISSPDFAGERLVACYNPLLDMERARKREALLETTAKKLQEVVEATQRKIRPLTGKDKIGLRVGRILGKSKVAKHFDIDIGDQHFTFVRNDDRIEAEKGLDGIYVIRTSVGDDLLTSEHVVAAYKSLAQVEQAFRCLKTTDLEIRPIFHRKAERVRAHVFLCMLAYYVEWHLRQRLAPLLFDDHDPADAAEKRKSIVAKAQRSDAAIQKASTHRTDGDLPVHSFAGLLDHLATLSRCRVQLGQTQIWKTATPTPLQRQAFALLEVPPP